ncbi:MAG: septum formation initiator family protein [Patescibacteria group bacterium]|nr:septum formation initiator family protein [Patescibacteria group bacterium]
MNMKNLIIAIVAVVILALAWFTIQLFMTHGALVDAESSAQQQLAALQQDSADLKSDLRYLQDPANLEKELKSRTNYKNPGETMVIVVPESAATSTQ